MEKEKLKTVNVDQATHKKLKLAATKKGVTIKKIVEEISENLNDK